jgi:hypothetical protein
MKITLQEDGHRLLIHLPLRFLFSRFLWHRLGQDHNPGALSPFLRRRLFKSLKAFRKANGPFTIVEIHSADNEEVLIRL